MVRAGRNRLMSAAWAGCLGFALALAGCTVFPSTPTAHTTRPPKPTALPNPWRQVMLPTGATMDGHSSLTISPLDGSNAWFCTLADAGTFSVWTTHDAGVTWRQISTLSPSGPAKPWGCALTIDQRDPQTLVVMFQSGGGEAGDLHSISYLSTDGGAQWTRVPGLIGVDQLESAGGNLYAILTDTAADPAIQFPQLAVSTDDLQTWKGLRPSSLTAQDTLFRFWVDQSGRPLFAASYRGSLWQTTDQGAIWTQLPSPPAPAPPAPPMQIDLGVRLTQQSQWDFCGWSTPPVIVQCSTDMGAS